MLFIADVDAITIRIGQWLREYRQEHNLTQIDLADRAGLLHDVEVSRLENGKVALTLPMLAKILLAINYTAKDFLALFKLIPDGLNEYALESCQEIGQLIQQERMDAGFSLRGLAPLVGLSHTSVRKLEGWHRQVRVSTLIAVDQALGLDGHLLLTALFTAMEVLKN